MVRDTSLPLSEGPPGPDSQRHVLDPLAPAIVPLGAREVTAGRRPRAPRKRSYRTVVQLPRVPLGLMQ